MRTVKTDQTGQILLALSCGGSYMIISVDTHTDFTKVDMIPKL